MSVPIAEAVTPEAHQFKYVPMTPVPIADGDMVYTPLTHATVRVGIFSKKPTTDFDDIVKTAQARLMKETINTAVFKTRHIIVEVTLYPNDKTRSSLYVGNRDAPLPKSTRIFREMIRKGTWTSWRKFNKTFPQIAEDVAQEVAEDPPQEASQDAPQKASQEASQDPPQEASQEASQHVPSLASSEELLNKSPWDFSTMGNHNADGNHIMNEPIRDPQVGQEYQRLQDTTRCMFDTKRKLQRCTKEMVAHEAALKRLRVSYDNLKQHFTDQLGSFKTLMNLEDGGLLQ